MIIRRCAGDAARMLRNKYIHILLLKQHLAAFFLCVFVSRVCSFFCCISFVAFLVSTRNTVCIDYSYAELGSARAIRLPTGPLTSIKDVIGTFFVCVYVALVDGCWRPHVPLLLCAAFMNDQTTINVCCMLCGR